MSTLVLKHGSTVVRALCTTLPGYVITATDDGDMFCWDAKDGSCHSEMYGHVAPVWCISPTCSSSPVSICDPSNQSPNILQVMVVWVLSERQ